MSHSARYVTQSSIWDAQVTGPLTSRRIAKYQAAGWYDGIKRDARKAKAERNKTGKSKSKTNVLALLLE